MEYNISKEYEEFNKGILNGENSEFFQAISNKAILNGKGIEFLQTVLDNETSKEIEDDDDGDDDDFDFDDEDEEDDEDDGWEAYWDGKQQAYDDGIIDIHCKLIA